MPVGSSGNLQWWFQIRWRAHEIDGFLQVLQKCPITCRNQIAQALTEIECLEHLQQSNPSTEIQNVFHRETFWTEELLNTFTSSFLWSEVRASTVFPILRMGAKTQPT